MIRFAAVFLATLTLAAAAEAQEKHPSFPEGDMMNPYSEGRAAHLEKQDSAAREWREDWYGYAEQRYGTNPIDAASDKPDSKKPAANKNEQAEPRNDSAESAQ